MQRPSKLTLMSRLPPKYRDHNELPAHLSTFIVFNVEVVAGECDRPSSTFGGIFLFAGSRVGRGGDGLPPCLGPCCPWHKPPCCHCPSLCSSFSSYGSSLCCLVSQQGQELPGQQPPCSTPYKQGWPTPQTWTWES